MRKRFIRFVLVFIATCMLMPAIYASQQKNCSSSQALLELSKKLFTNSTAVHYTYKGSSQFVKGSVKMDRNELKKHIQKYDDQSAGCLDAPLIIAISKAE